MQILQGPWARNHLDEHKEMFDNLIRILSDLEHAVAENDKPVTLPRTKEGVISWGEISVSFLIQWYMLNSQKVTHQHLVEAIKE